MRFHRPYPGHTVRKKKVTMGNTDSCIGGDEAVQKGLLVEGDTTLATISESEPPKMMRRSWHSHKRCSSQNTDRGKTWHGFKKSQETNMEIPNTETTTHHRTSFRKSIRQKSSKAVHKTRHAISHFFHSIEEFMFPRSPLHAELANRPAVYHRGTLLYGCETTEQHYQKATEQLEIIRDLHSFEGLTALGFEYRLVPCDEHKSIPDDEEEEEPSGQEGFELARLASLSLSSPDMLSTEVTSEITSSLRSNCSSNTFLDMPLQIPPPLPNQDHCHLCMRRLYHVESNTRIDSDNRKKYIADGDHYEGIARLCQEYAHQVMCQEGNLEWITVEDDDDDDHREPIRALVNSNHPLIRMDSQEDIKDSNNNPMQGRPTILIATGKGKVRAGIFSRQHLMCTSLESSTALPIVREAQRRKLNIVIVDPNVHGDTFGYETFKKSMTRLFQGWENNNTNDTTSACAVPLESRDLYILSHSASGAQLARYLMDKTDAYLPHIKAIAFTDSTHNVQWCKKYENDDLYDMLQSDMSVYFRCANHNRDGNRWYLHSAGEQVPTDSFWEHRFGRIKTYWAGTNEHSLTNWYAHAKIWEHFDQFLFGREENNNSNDSENNNSNDES